MFNVTSQYYSEDFKSRILSEIRFARKAFNRSVFKDENAEGAEARMPTDSWLLAGHRYMSDEEVWQAFTAQFASLIDYEEEETNREMAEMVSDNLAKDEESMRAAVIEALAEAARTDYYYRYEKSYEEAESPEPEEY